MQSGLRDISKLPDYNDTPVYQAKYNQLLVTPWSSVFDDFSIFSSEYDVRDSGYEVFMKLTQYISRKFIFFMFITAILFIVPFGVLVHRYIKTYLGIILSFTIYFSLFTNIVNSFMRQAVVLGIILFAIKFIVSRDWKKYFLVILIAFSIHFSSIVAIPFYFLPKLASSRKWLLFSYALSPVLFFFKNSLFSFFLTGTAYDNYMSAEAVNPTNYVLFLISIALLSYLFYKDICKVVNYEILISGVIGTMLLLPVIFMGNTMLRISYYYVIVTIPLIPVILDSLNRNIRIPIYFCTIAFFLLFIFG